MATILVVDDRPSNREFLVTLLGYMHHRLLEASDGEEALATALAECPDLVITDVVMPASDGYEFARQIRMHPAIAHTPVIFYTAAYEQDEARKLADSIGIVHFLRKPTDPERILETVNAVLGTPRTAPGSPTEAFDRDHLRLVTDTLARKVEQLETEIVERKRAEEAVRTLNAELEERILQRTARLESLNRHLEAEIQERTRLAESLRQNTVLTDQLNARLQRAIRETHHRVKNSLQVIAALVDMQSGEVGASSSFELRRINQHILALATIHDMLTHQEVISDSARLSVKDALDRLVPILQEIIGEQHICVAAEDVLLPMGQITSLSILVNELVNNAVKHGRGDIGISVAVVEGCVKLAVSDEGSGFSVDFDPQSSANVGLGLIDSIGRWDLSGEIDYANGPRGGACVTVKFPL